MPTKKETKPKASKKSAPKQAAVKVTKEKQTKEEEIVEADNTPVMTGELTNEEQALEETGIADIVEDAEEKEAVTLKQGRRKLVKQMQTHDKDSGSTEVQVALLTGKINDLVKHLKDHPQDNDSRQGLLKMVGRRRRLLRFLKKGSETKYQNLIAELKLRK